MSGQDESWLSRWSRRKDEARREVTEPSGEVRSADVPPQPKADESTANGFVAPTSAEAGGGVPAAQPEREGGSVQARENLPSIESITYESDFTPFMNPAVPEATRREALRKLWQSNPLLANLDGLNDYDEDYSMIGMVEEVVDTVYKVGRGMADLDEETKGLEGQPEGEAAAVPPVNEPSAPAVGKAEAIEEAGNTKVPLPPQDDEKSGDRIASHSRDGEEKTSKNA